MKGNDQRHRFGRDRATQTAPTTAKSTPIEALQHQVGNRATRALVTDELAPPIVHEVLRSSGLPLDRSLRAALEPQIGRDLGDVRIHTDDRAAASARAVDAEAYTAGSHVVFDQGKYAPTTGAGRALIAHELTHVAQQNATTIPAQLRIGSPTSAQEGAARSAEIHGPTSTRATGTGAVLQRQEPRATRRAREEAEAVSRDYTDAQSYLTDFYATALEIHRALVSATQRAIGKFSEVTKIQDSRLGANITYQLVRIVLGILPGAKGVVELFDAIAKGTKIAVQGARLATIGFTVAQRSAAGMYGASAPGVTDERRAVVKALDSLSTFDTDGAQAVLAERAENRKYAENIGQMKEYRKGVLDIVRDALGPKPQFSATDVRRYEAEYEMRLYREYYVQHGWINHVPPSLFGRPYTSYRIVDVPEAAQARLLALHRALGYTAQVAIDTRFSASDPNYGETVKVLLDWGVKLYWLRHYVSEKPEELHTGDDLRMPYRGARYGEVK